MRLVSILINNYNYGKFLREAINSALDQSYKNTEVIVVDDGSTDNSASIIAEFGDRIQSISKQNGGQASAYNAGFAASKGELVHFLDADDILDQNAIAEAVSVWKPGVAKVHFYLRVIEGAKGKATESVLPATQIDNGDIRQKLGATGTYSSPPASGNLFWRPALERIFPMPEKEWITAADTYPIFLAPLFGEVCACNKILGYYRIHDSNHDAQTIVNSKLLRYRLEKERMRDALLTVFCPIAGVPYKAGTVGNSLANVKLRLASWSLDRRGHSHREAKPLPLAGRGIVLCWRNADWSARKRILYTGWILSLLILPNPICAHLVKLGFAPTKRWKPFQRWISVPPKGSVARHSTAA